MTKIKHENKLIELFFKLGENIMPDKTISEADNLEREIENRLQMIPHHADRRKFRGLIQRVRTFEKAQAHKHCIEMVEKMINKHSSEEIGMNTLEIGYRDGVQDVIKLLKQGNEE